MILNLLEVPAFIFHIVRWNMIVFTVWHSSLYLTIMRRIDQNFKNNKKKKR